jgi:hypothetical protein
MSQAVTAAGMDRLPWLPDEPSPPRRRGRNRELAGWAVAATLVVAGASYWMGARSWHEPSPAPVATQPSTTVPLPQPRRAEPAQPQVVFEPAPEVSPAPMREVPMARPRIERSLVRSRTTPAVHEPASVPIEQKPAAAAPMPAPAPQPVLNTIARPLTLWPATQSNGAYGRIVRIGAFGTRLQAKLGWRYMVQAYPAVAHLPAAVVETRNSRGRSFYRFQIGTTSQAHSEVLCQRMGKIHLSCAVVGLPWRPAGVER